MATPSIVEQEMAKQALLRDAGSRVAAAEARIAAVIQLGGTLTAMHQQAVAQLQTAKAAEDEAKSGGGSVLDRYGAYSSIDQLLRAERFAGKSASVDFVKEHPDCAESDAEIAWTAAATVATGLPALLVPVASYASLYRANLVQAGLIPEPTWEAQRAWIIATDKTVIMGA